MNIGSGGNFAERIDAIEEAYEFMLAYAAQGREDDHGPGGPGGDVRNFLASAVAAIDGLADSAVAEAGSTVDTDDAAWSDFLAMLRQDSDRAAIAMRLVLARPRISSALIDNLNASIHIRTLLTDLFLVDEALKSG